MSDEVTNLEKNTFFPFPMLAGSHHAKFVCSLFPVFFFFVGGDMLAHLCILLLFQMVEEANFCYRFYFFLMLSSLVNIRYQCLVLFLCFFFLVLFVIHFYFVHSTIEAETYRYKAKKQKVVLNHFLIVRLLFCLVKLISRNLLVRTINKKKRESL